MSVNNVTHKNQSSQCEHSVMKPKPKSSKQKLTSVVGKIKANYLKRQLSWQKQNLKLHSNSCFAFK